MGSKIFPEVKKKINEGMSDNDLISLFDVARKKLSTMRPVDIERDCQCNTDMGRGTQSRGRSTPGKATKVFKEQAAPRGSSVHCQ